MEALRAWTCSTLHKNSVVKAATAKDAALLFMFDSLHHRVLPQRILVEGNGDSKTFIVTSLIGEETEKYDEYNPRLKGADALAAQNDPKKPAGACCNNERRGMNGGCGNCGAPCL